MKYLHVRACVLSFNSTSNWAYTLSLSSNWPQDCLVSSCLQHKDMTHRQMHLSLTQRSHSLSISWLETSWLAWTSSSCLVQRNTWPGLMAVSILGSQAAYPNFCLVQLDVRQCSPTDTHPLTCSGCCTTAIRNPVMQLQLLALQHPPPPQNREPLIQE